MLAATPGTPLVPLTPDSDISPGLADYEARQRQRLVGMHVARRKLRCMMGAILSEYRDYRLYIAAGETSFDAFVANAELGFSARQAWRYIEYYRDSVRLTQPLPDAPALATAEQIDRIGPQKLAIVKPALEKAATAEERQDWLQQAEAQPYSALQISVQEHLGQPYTLRREFLAQQASGLRSLASLLPEPTADPFDVLKQLRAKVDTTEAALQAMPPE